VLDEKQLDSAAIRAYEAVADRLGHRPAWLKSRLWEIGRRTGEKRAGGAQV
jgi:hypothetical protein